MRSFHYDKLLKEDIAGSHSLLKASEARETGPQPYTRPTASTNTIILLEHSLPTLGMSTYNLYHLHDIPMTLFIYPYHCKPVTCKYLYVNISHNILIANTYCSITAYI